MFKCAFFFLSLITSSILVTPAFAEERVSEEDNKVYFTVGAKDKVTVEDGDTFWIGIHEIRLIGVDTVEKGQKCMINGETDLCSTTAQEKLEELIKLPSLTCEVALDGQGKPDKRYGRLNGLCTALMDGNRIDLSRQLIRSGWAFSLRGNDGKLYEKDEFRARENKLGLHAMSVDHPADYRKSKREAQKDDCTCK